MWTYSISTGELTDAAGAVRARGYSGQPPYRDNAGATYLKDRGPIPRGMYWINAPIDTRTHGPFVLWLHPYASNEMFGREGFGIHGDSIVNPGYASDGCIILPRADREMIWDSPDHTLQVAA